MLLILEKMKKTDLVHLKNRNGLIECVILAISYNRYWVRGHPCLMSHQYKSAAIPVCFGGGCSGVLLSVWSSLLVVFPLRRKFAALPACVMFALLAKVCDIVCLRTRCDVLWSRVWACGGTHAATLLHVIQNYTVLSDKDSNDSKKNM